MAEAESREARFDLSGGHLALDFANAVNWRHSHQPQERFNRFADLLAWGQQAGVVRDSEARRLLRESRSRPAHAVMVLHQAIALREAIYRIFSAVTGGQQPQAADLETLNTALSEGLRRAGIVPSPQGFTWGWVKDDQALDRVLWPVARSAGELLTSADLRNVRECAGDRCGWLFMDMSPAGRRRWCDMKVCGNRAKARRHYERTKQGSG